MFNVGDLVRYWHRDAPQSLGIIFHIEKDSILSGGRRGDVYRVHWFGGSRQFWYKQDELILVTCD
jgi:hypothetical protein